MAAGLVIGLAVHAFAGPSLAAEAGYYLHAPAAIFLRLIKMIIAPLVIATLVSGIGHLGDVRAMGRIGGCALIWFLLAGIFSLAIGLLLVNIFQPGAGLGMVATHIEVAGHSTTRLERFIDHVVPSSMIGALADNEILQVVIISLFVGVALAALGEHGTQLLSLVEALTELMLKVTGYVMLLAPLAVFGAIASVLATKGIDVVGLYGELVLEFYLGIGIFAILLGLACIVAIGLPDSRQLAQAIRQPIVLAFSTASSEAAYPKLLEQLDRLGIPRRISAFVLPLGYSFNLDGSMMYASFATIFIAQAYGITLSPSTQLEILLTLMVMSKGIAGVPRASLVVISATLAQHGLPIEGIALILAIDHFLDMGRTATNVLGNAIAIAVISKIEIGGSATLVESQRLSDTSSSLALDT